MSEIETIKQHLKQDQFLSKYVDSAELEILAADTPDMYFCRLARAIVYQQLSGKAAGTIHSRFAQLFPDQNITAEFLVALPHEQIRATGVSNAKANYIRNIAEAVLEGNLRFGEYSQLENEDIINELSSIKGIGRWTAEMFLMFTMGRPDVFSFGDLGLAKGVEKIYGFNYKQHKSKVIGLLEQWAPYRSYASQVLWHSVDTQI